ncbi:uncharacterized protein DUF58 [Actinocorallia herbida]|uniref:Uncharacterized protein DUF58 n=1 Tax=Actinocorallia herbida TaxID=58109 RepID=A0A3N1DBA9_9ACTN|nr:DUF58 domain-containing protein [Actinocorallia herbida]ROO90811.1 uncharacterized protein DUF58 [Actinocorallia herbida]
MTQSGRFVVGVGAAFTVAGIALSYREFLLVGGCLLLLAGGAAAVVRWPSGARVRTGARVVRVTRGEPMGLPMEVHGTRDRLGLLRSLAVRVGDVEADVAEHADGTVLELGPGTARRGVFELVPSMVVREPLGLAERLLGSLDRVTLIVHPASVPMPPQAASWAADGPDGPAERDPTSFHSLRDYVIGDSLRHVHWPTSARVGRLVVRQLTDAVERSLTVVLDTDARAYADAAEFEASVETAASLLHAMADLPGRNTASLRAGGTVLVGERRVEEVRPFLDALAAVTPGAIPLRRGRPPRGGRLVVVTGGVDRGQHDLLRRTRGTARIFRITRAQPPSIQRRPRVSTVTAPDAAEAARLLQRSR